jgi:hypothetical protein
MDLGDTYIRNDDYSEEDRLTGQIVLAANIDTSHEVIELVLNGGRLLYLQTEGDCCSHSWFEHIESVRSLIGQEILSLESRPFNSFHEEDTDGYGYEYIKVYGFAIVTAIGKTVVEFRNSSNGYYGGSIRVTKNLYDWKTYTFTPLGDF